MALNAQIQEAVRQAAEAIRNGHVVIYPTDTAYGLGADPRNPEAVQRVLDAKGRTDTKFTLIANSLEQVEEYHPLSETAWKIARRSWPGPLSIAINDQYAIRVPNNEIAQALAAAVGYPIIATSANRSGNGEVYTAQEAEEAFGKDEIAFIIDGGALEPVQPSTIIRVYNNDIDIIRQGPIQIDTE